jgi:hypothetical protein
MQNKERLGDNFKSAVANVIASKPALNTNCGEPGNGTSTVAKKITFSNAIK